ncbi:MAG: glycosyltransferase family 39 protein [Deltaproteobacteria bacterium]|nr:glycosyltransferase family 39 protein [Deltaproteobacteria bacterium]MBW2360932.1 glycosyltransferase family 39 protein [Deltaproteobacteria bacterium]
MQSGDDKYARVAAAAWCALGGAICFTMAQLEPNLLEEGLLLHVGERLVAGERLYSDIVLVTGPVPYTLVGAVFWLFGPSMLAARAAVALLQALACAAAYDMGRRGGAGPWAHAAAAALAFAPVLLFPLLSAAFYTTISTSLTFSAAWLALRGVDSARWGVAAGAAIALTALSKQTVGALLAVLFVTTVATCAPRGLRLRHALAVCAGGAGTAILTLAWYGAGGDLEVFVSSLLATPSGSVFNSPFIDLWPPGELSPELKLLEYYYVPEIVFILRDGKLNSPPFLVFLSQLLFILPVAVLAVTALRRAFGPLPAAIWIFAGATLACGSNLLPRADSGHLVFAAPAALAYAFCLVPLCLPTREAARRTGATLGAGAAIAVLAGTSLWVSSQLFEIAGAPSYGPKVPVRPVSPPKRGDAVPRVIRYLRTNLEANEPIFVARTEPLIYFATDAPNPTPYTGALQVWGIRGEQQDTILTALDNVRFAVMSDLDEPVHTFYRDELPRVQEAFERFYHVPSLFAGRKREEDWLLVLERGADRGPTLIDLRDPTLGAKAWIRKPDGSRTPAPGPMLDLPTRQNRRPLAHALGARGGGVDWEFRVPRNARLQVATGFKNLHRSKQPNRLQFLVRLSTGGNFETLASRRVKFDPPRGNGRRWNEIEVDLSRFANRQVVLRLEALADNVPRPGRVAFWGSPRLAGPPEAEGSSPAAGS